MNNKEDYIIVNYEIIKKYFSNLLEHICWHNEKRLFHQKRILDKFKTLVKELSLSVILLKHIADIGEKNALLFQHYDQASKLDSEYLESYA